ncbi:FecR family protein [Caballeronia sp. HLA56]
MRQPIQANDASPPDLDIEQQAATWFVRRRAKAGAPDDAAFAAWLAQSTAHRDAYAHVAETWHALDDVPREDIARLKAGFAPPALVSSSRRSFMPRFALAGTAVAAVGGALGWTLLRDEWRNTPTYAQRFDTRRGELLAVSLPDGSTLQLDTDTHLEARFFPDRREVHVTRGQAMFAVQSNPDAPFNVLARTVTVTVVGTRFAVRCTDTGVERGNVRVDVDEGRVRVASTLPPGVELVAGQTVATDAEGRLGRIASIAPGDVGAWREGRVSFDNTTLARVVQEFERYAPLHVVIDDPVVASMAVTGSFDVRQSASFIRALQRVLPVRVRSRGDATEIVRAA